MHDQPRPGRLPAPPLGLPRPQELQRVQVDPSGEPLDALERQVALPALDAAHVRAVDTEDIGEGLLAEAAGLPVGPQVQADDALQVSFGHGLNLARCYLTVYRLISSVRVPMGRSLPRAAMRCAASSFPPQATIPTGTTTQMRRKSWPVLSLLALATSLAVLSFGTLFVGGAQAQAPRASEPNESWWAPGVLPGGGEIEASFDTSNDRELFVFQVGSLAQADIRLTILEDPGSGVSEECDLELVLMGADAGRWDSRPNPGTDGVLAKDESRLLYTLTPGRYHLGIDREEHDVEDCNGTVFKLSFAPASALVPIADVATPLSPLGEPNESAASAIGPLQTGIGYQAALETNNDVDWYYMYVLQPGTVSLRAEGSAYCDWHSLSLGVYRDGDLESAVAKVVVGNDYAPAIGFGVQPGKYYIHAPACPDAPNPYTFRLDPGGMLGPELPVLDTDGDGVPDGTDQCPQQPGPPPPGCPDRDRDGVFDAADKCPDRAGRRRATGCPPRTAYRTTLRLRRIGRRTYRGKLSTPGGACRYNRRVVLRRVGKGRHSYATAHTLRDGRFTLRPRRRLRGRVYAVASERTTASSLCRVGTSRRVRARSSASATVTKQEG